MKPRTTREPLRPKIETGSSVKIIGLGGVGSIVARYGSVFLASLRNTVFLTLMDGDKFEPSNASRMIFGDCGNKAEVLYQDMAPRFKDTNLVIDRVRRYVTPGNIKKLIEPGDIVLMCVDNHPTRQLVNRHCQKLKNIVLISGGNDGVEKDKSGKVHRGTYGNVQIYVRRKGKDITHDLAAFHPEIAHPEGKMPHQKNCTELVVSVPQILFANMAVASAMLNTLLLHLSGQTHYSELCFDIAEGLMRPTLRLKQ